ncbi:hypothetical protein C4D60_Mb08t22670 [Musa balbisiana]|uniref:Exonuclease domain-containing protein n=1 Tax=Musa balbisiana TaxID=52838 RepID=A0A4V4H949_MUSBA|nr:hypothetical protein C4D60_Mb08t22670 [Musa balbisiana]
MLRSLILEFCRAYGLWSRFLRMSLAAIWSANLYQLWNSLGSNSTFTFLRFSTTLVPEKPYDTRRRQLQQLRRLVQVLRWEPRSFITSCSHPEWKVEKVTDRSSTNKDINQPELNKLKTVQCYHIQENISIRKAFDRPATILVFDIETTGFSRQNERIIEFALRDLIGGKNSTFQTLINPEKDVLNAYIHGIRTYMVNRPDVPTFRELVPILLQYVRSRQVEGRPVIWVAHNGRRFDVPFMIREFQRCSVDIPPDWMFVDTLPLARQLVKADVKNLNFKNNFKRITFDLKLSVPELMNGAFRASDIIKIPPEKQDGAHKALDLVVGVGVRILATMFMVDLENNGAYEIPLVYEGIYVMH